MIYILFLQKETFFKINRYYLLSTLLLGLAIPYVGSYLPTNSASQEVYSAMLIMTPQTFEIAAAPEQGYTFSWMHLIWGVYAMGALIVLSRLLFGLHKIYKIYRSGEKSYTQHYTLIQSEKPHLPFSFFNMVFLSKSVPLKGDMLQIIEHEKLHVKQWHSIDILLAEIIQVFFWFNPVIPFYKRALKQSHEYLADAYVTDIHEKNSYGQLLLGQSSSGLEIALANHFFNSQIKKRMKMLYKEKSKRPAMVKYLAAVPVLALMLIIFSSHINFSDKVDSNPVIEVPGGDSPQLDTLPTGNQAYFRVKSVDASDAKVDFNKKGSLNVYVFHQGAQLIEGTDYTIAKDGKISFLKGTYGKVEVAYSNQKPDADGKIELPPPPPPPPAPRSHPVAKKNGSLLPPPPPPPPPAAPNMLDKITVTALGSSDPSLPPPPPPPPPRELIVSGKYTIYVDGKEVDKEYAANIKVEDIHHMSVKKSKNGEKPTIHITKLNTFNAAYDNSYKVVEEMPRFPGCEGAATTEEKEKCAKEQMLKFVYKNLKYPAGARKSGVQGMVVVRFIIDKNGNVTQPNVIREIGAGCGDAALKVVESFPKWIAGKQSGKNVSVQYTLPIKFKLHVEDVVEEVVEEKKAPMYQSVTVDGKVAQVLVQEVVEVPNLKSFDKDVLIILDGKEYNKGLNTIDPESIKTMSVLKGKSGESLYGSKAKNGVVVIGTKIVVTGKRSTSKTIVGSDEVYKIVDEMPRFPGCEDMEGTEKEKKMCAQRKMLEFIYQNLKYPSEAREKDIEGVVVLQFIIDKNEGAIRDIKVVRNVGGGCSEAAVEAVKSMPNFITGKKRGKPVSVLYTIPVKFKLAGGATEKKAPKKMAVFLDGKQIFPENNQKFYSDYMIILNEKEGLEKYGEVGKHGVLEIFTKKDETSKRSMEARKLDLKVANIATPNPASELVNIRFDVPKGSPANVTLFDMSGKVIKEYRNLNGYIDYNVDLRSVSNQTIIVQVTQGKKVYTEKVVVR